MWIQKRIYLFSEKLNLVVNKPYIFILTKFSYIKIKIASPFWIKQMSSKRWSLCFINKQLLKQFITYFFNRYNLKKSLYFYKLRLKGLGFRIIKLATGLIRFYFNKRNFIYFNVPNNIIVKNKRRLLFFISPYWDILKIIISHILLLNKLGVYNTRGLLYPHQLRTLKPGKKRF